MLKNLCRLCLGINGLLWVFDENVCHNMRDIIKVTSGVEILKTDSVTQMVCRRCCQIILKMYEFRIRSIKNDLDLKAQCVDYNLGQLTSVKKKESEQDNTFQDSPCVILKTEDQSGTANKVPCVFDGHKNTQAQCVGYNQDNIPCVIPGAEKQSEIASKVPCLFNRYKNAHQSIKKLVRKNPTWKLRIPESYLNSHFEPCLSLQRIEVSESFEQREPLPKKMKKTTEIAQTPTSKAFGDIVKSIKAKIASNNGPKEETWKKIDGGVKSNVSAITPEEEPSPAQPSTAETPINQTVKPKPRAQSILSSGDEFEQKPVKTRTDSNRDSRKTPLTEVAEIDKTPPKVDDDSKLFTSSPILKKPQYVACNNNSEDEQVSKTTDMNRNLTDSANKTSKEVLESGCSNMPDMSLLSVTSRTQILHTCKVCDSQHQNRRSLYHHMKKTHTKCPFCSRAFRTTDLRNEHVQNEHVIDKRMDESGQIRKKYPTLDEDEPGGNVPDDKEIMSVSVKESDTLKEKEPQIRVNDSGVLRDTDLYNSDVEVLETILLNQSRVRGTLEKSCCEAMVRDCPMEDDSRRADVHSFKGQTGNCVSQFPQNTPGRDVANANTSTSTAQAAPYGTSFLSRIKSLADVPSQRRPTINSLTPFVPGSKTLPKQLSFRQGPNIRVRNQEELSVPVSQTSTSLKPSDYYSTKRRTLPDS